MNQPVMDHWTTVKRIHQSALDVDRSERAAFVDESCGGDEALRLGGQEDSLCCLCASVAKFLQRPRDCKYCRFLAALSKGEP